MQIKRERLNRKGLSANFDSILRLSGLRRLVVNIKRIYKVVLYETSSCTNQRIEMTCIFVDFVDK